MKRRCEEMLLTFFWPSLRGLRELSVSIAVFIAEDLQPYSLRHLLSDGKSSHHEATLQKWQSIITALYDETKAQVMGCNLEG